MTDIQDKIKDTSGEEAVSALIEFSSNGGRAALQKELCGERGETPAFYFLTKVLDHVSLAYPHIEGDLSENEKKYLTVKRQIRNEFYKELVPRIEAKIQQFVVIQLSKLPSYRIKFSKPTRATE